MEAGVEGKTSEGAAVRRSALFETHERARASMRERDGWLVPAAYGDVSAEYEAVRGGESAGLFDLSSRGRVEVSGTEAVQFLNGMITNDIAALADGAWMHAAFPNVQGRLLASVRVIRHAGIFLFDTEAATHAALLKTLERFTLAGDFHVRDTTAETAMISLQGARAAEIVAAVLGAEAASLARGRVALAGQSEGREPLLLIRATHTGEDGFDVFAGASSSSALWDALVEAGARPAGFDALEILRVEAGVPRYGLDATDANVVLEVLDEAEAVSYTKGCYVGQEIIARIHWRGHVAKKLTSLVLDEEVEPPAPGARLKSLDGEREVGRITSVVSSPRMGATVALGLVRYEHLTPGTKLRVFDGEEFLCEASVAALPLVRGGWYADADGKEPQS
jgi:folate-binding protein YgfZ